MFMLYMRAYIAVNCTVDQLYYYKIIDSLPFLIVLYILALFFSYKFITYLIKEWVKYPHIVACLLSQYDIFHHP